MTYGSRLVAGYGGCETGISVGDALTIGGVPVVLRLLGHLVVAGGHSVSLKHDRYESFLHQ